MDRLVQAIVLVTDLEAARAQMESLGFTVLEGGRHPRRGTANLIVPFGRQYLELLAVVDEAEALESAQGRPVLAALSGRGPGLARWSVEPGDIEVASARVGRPIERRQRILPDGRAVRWRSVGVDEAWAEPWRCAFMAWDDPDLHPARSVVAHQNGASGFSRIDVEVPDEPALLDWLGGAVPVGLHLFAGTRSGPRALCLASPAGEIPLTEITAFGRA